MYLLLASAAACSSTSPPPPASATESGEAGDASTNYGPCMPGDGTPPPCSTCECAGGAWQPITCPTELPGPGQECSPEGAYCGFTTETNPCGAAECDCQKGTWSCGPTCEYEAGASTD